MKKMQLLASSAALAIVLSGGAAPMAQADGTVSATHSDYFKPIELVCKVTGLFCK